MKALIVGGGIAGPVLAMWLRKLGHGVVIAEKRAGSMKGEGAFLGVAPNGMNVLKQLGLDVRGFACSAFHFQGHTGKSIGAIDRSGDVAKFGAALTMVRRGELQDVLMAAAVAAGAEVRLGARLVSVSQTAAEVTAVFDGGVVEKADVLIACDGLRSVVRKQVMPKTPEPEFSGLWDCGGFAKGVKVPFAAGVNGMVFGRRAFFGAFDTGEEIWWFHNGPMDVTGDVRAKLLELHRGDPSWISDVIEATAEPLGPWPLFDLPSVKKWSEGRVCLIGDAAHAMSPSAGQGASMAMEDAMVLAKCLRDFPEAPVAFAAFEKVRRDRVMAIFQHARRSGSGKAVTPGFGTFMRDLLMPTFLRMGEKFQSKGYAHQITW